MWGFSPFSPMKMARKQEWRKWQKNRHFRHMSNFSQKSMAKMAMTPPLKLDHRPIIWRLIFSSGHGVDKLMDISNCKERSSAPPPILDNNFMGVLRILLLYNSIMGPAAQLVVHRACFPEVDGSYPSRHCAGP